MKSYLLKSVAATIVAFGLASLVRADLVFYDHYVPGVSPSDPDSETEFIEDELGIDLMYLGRINDELDDPFDLIGDEIEVSFVDNQTVEISWDLTGTGYILRAVYLKDGVFGDSLYTVTADQYVMSGSVQTVTLQTGSTQGSISHVSFFGQAAGVPDGSATLLLLGLGFSAIGLISRRTRKT